MSTMQQSQTDAPINAQARAANPEGEWDEWQAAILRELIKDLRSEEARNEGGKHGQARIRNLRWAIAIAEKQMAIPYQWHRCPKSWPKYQICEAWEEAVCNRRSRRSSMTLGCVWWQR